MKNRNEKEGILRSVLTPYESITTIFGTVFFATNSRNLMEKVERLEQGYNKLRKVSEFIMSIVECMDPEDLKRKAFEKGKRELSIPTGLPPC